MDFDVERVFRLLAGFAADFISVSAEADAVGLVAGVIPIVAS